MDCAEVKYAVMDIISSAETARGLCVPGMTHHWAHLAASVIALPMGAGCVLTFLDRTPDGMMQRSVWCQPDNDPC